MLALIVFGLMVISTLLIARARSLRLSNSRASKLYFASGVGTIVLGLGVIVLGMINT